MISQDSLHAVRRNATSASPEPFGHEVDAAALDIAQRIRSKMSLKIALPWDDWCQLTALIQVEVARAIRHAAFDAPVYPARIVGAGRKDGYVG